MKTKSKHEALAKAKEEGEHTMRKVHVSDEYCRHCGKKTARHERHESSHKEYDHEK